MKTLRTVFADEIAAKEEDAGLINKLLRKMCYEERAALTSGRLKEARHTKEEIHFESIVEPQQSARVDFNNVTCWYRCMTREDFIYLAKHDQMPEGKYFMGIAPNYSYSKDYAVASTGQTHLVEFVVDRTGEELKALIDERQGVLLRNPKFPKTSVKGEGGGTIGLGKTGLYKGLAGTVFNELLAGNNIQFRLVYFKMKLD